MPNVHVRHYIARATEQEIRAFCRRELEAAGWREVTEFWLRAVGMQASAAHMLAAGGGMVLSSTARSPTTARCW